MGGRKFPSTPSNLLRWSASLSCADNADASRQAFPDSAGRADVSAWYGVIGGLPHDYDLAPVHITGVVHDTGDMRYRVDYVRRLMQSTITLIAVSEAVRRYLLDDAGIALERVRTVRNGIDVRRPHPIRCEP